MPGVDSRGASETDTGTSYYAVIMPPEIGSGTLPAPSPHYDIPITMGWNLISFPVADWGPPETVLDDAGGDTSWSVVKWYTPQDPMDPWKTYRVGGTANDLTYIDNTMGLWVFITG